jgi:hypothetical protein
LTAKIIHSSNQNNPGTEMKKKLILFLLMLNCLGLQAQTLPGFKATGTFGEQQMLIENSPPSTRILINAPLKGFGQNARVLLVFYALPNGNNIEQTFGKTLEVGDDWHYNIQHIGAQTRFLRELQKKQTIVTVYLEACQKSWPAWVAKTNDSVQTVKRMVDNIKAIFAPWHPQVVLNGHSGGGRFVFSYLDAVETIPSDVVRIAFLDSNYGYVDSLHGSKILTWLKSGRHNCLSVLAYNDSIVVYNGKQLVSPTGGTWYRSKLMKKFLAQSFTFKKEEDDSIIWNSALKRRVEIILKTNPNNKIYHTTQVERNGFIHSMVSGTRYGKRGYSYFGERTYSKYIGDSLLLPIRRLNIPPRKPDDETGSSFMKRIASLPPEEREEEIFHAISSGNVPDFLRNTVTLTGKFADSAGTIHRVVYEAMPDYLAIGSNQDYCRIPMNPYTAQNLAYQFGGSMITAKLSDHIYQQAEIKLTPFNYIPVGNANELVTKFEEHNSQIEKQFRESGGKPGQLVAGIKKDIVLTTRNATQPGKVVLYGWHKPDGKPIQPVYSGHIYWYVDYSHGIRLINNQVMIDGKRCLFTDILKDPFLYKILSDETKPMETVGYRRKL